MARAALILSIIALVLASIPLVHMRAPVEEQHDAYIPGLGEIMTATQMRHAKLALAGSLGNWPLADYELDEIDEGFQDALKYHPTHKDVKQPLTELLPAFVKTPLEDLRAAVKEKDPAKFNTAFDELSTGCNGCHQAVDFGFNVVIRPTVPPVPNQDFAPTN